MFQKLSYQMGRRGPQVCLVPSSPWKRLVTLQRKQGRRGGGRGGGGHHALNFASYGLACLKQCRIVLHNDTTVAQELKMQQYNTSLQYNNTLPRGSIAGPQTGFCIIMWAE